MSHSILMMNAFLEQAAFFYKSYFQEPLPEPRVSTDVEGDPKADWVDAHWKTNSWELLLSLEDGGFQFYGDNLGESKRKVNFADANPKSLALSIYMLSRL